MIQRHACCHRAATRQIAASSDSVWISEALLLNAYERFLTASKTTRRHGSFVPGPLESRRRLGKRRLAYMTESGPSAFGPRELLGWPGESDNTQWQWKAPTKRSVAKPTSHKVLDWLSGWGVTAREDAIAVHAEVKHEHSSFNVDRLHELKRALQDSSLDPVIEHCSQFNRDLRQSLAIAEVSEAVLNQVLWTIPPEIASSCLDSRAVESQLLLLYQAIWDGISSCRVHDIGHFEGRTMNALLSLICDLPMSLPARILARQLVTNLSSTQLEMMNSSIVKLAKSWVRSWLNEAKMDVHDRQSSAAFVAVENSGHSVGRAEDAVQRARASRCAEKDLVLVYKTLKQTKDDIVHGVKAIKLLERSSFPLQSSMTHLVETLSSLTPISLRYIVNSCTSDIVALCEARTPSQTKIRFSWLSLVAQLPNADLELFTKTWKMVEESSYIPQDFGSDLILSHMESQQLIEEPVLLRNSFEAAPCRATLKDYRHILYALHKYQGSQKHGLWHSANYLFELLSNLNRHKSIYTTFRTAKDLRLKLPIEILRRNIEAVSASNPSLALHMYHMYCPVPYGRKLLNIFECDEFILGMIQAPKIQSRTIWNVLQIPQYADLRRNQWPGRKDCTPFPGEISLITKMATAFSKTSSLRQRSAARNVMQCLYHLSRYQIPVSAELSRAVCQAGITRKIIERRWIGSDSLTWALSVIEKAEGQEVRNTIDRAAWHWREHLVHEQRNEKRSL